LNGKPFYVDTDRFPELAEILTDDYQIFATDNDIGLVN
jgi:hypothetical protein